AHGHDLCRPWPCRHAPRSAVEAHAKVRAVDRPRRRMHIDVADDVDVHARDGRVVKEVRSIPIATVVAHADVAEAIVDAAVVADVQTPVATVPAIAVA